MKPAITSLVFILATFLGVVGSASTPKPYLIEHVLIHARDGAILSALVVRPAGATRRLPAAFEFTIYVDSMHDLERLGYAANRGYVGVMAYTRGKGATSQQSVPYEYDGRDADSVIDWIAAQRWSNGEVGMMGGSYDGFTQWAAAKFANPHLKTIVPVVPNNPGNGLPMQNSIFLLANYAWIYYVTETKRSTNRSITIPNGRSFRCNGIGAEDRIATSRRLPEYRIRGFTRGCSIRRMMPIGN